MLWQCLAAITTRRWNRAFQVDSGGEPVETTTGGGDHGGGGLPSKTTCGSQAQASLPCGVSVDSGGYWADVLASALAPGEGHLPVAYREITRLVSLHAEAGHVFVNCAARLGLQPDDDEDNGGGGGARTGL